MERYRTRIAVAGAGYIGKAHIDVIRQSQSCTLAAIIDPSLQARTLAHSLGVPWYGALDALLAVDKPDGMVVATPNHLHVEHTLSALSAGVAVLLEKPVAPNVEQASCLAMAAASTGARLLIGHHRTYSAILGRTLEVLGSGELGRLVAINGSATFYKPDTYFEAGPWRSATGGGPILINLIHEIHTLRLLCGEVVAVQAMASNRVRQFEVEDSVVINLRFDSGVLGTFVLSDTAVSTRSWEQTSGENLAYPRDRDADCYVIHGTRGSLAVPTMRLQVCPEGHQASWWEPVKARTLSLEAVDPLVLQMQHFEAVILARAKPRVTVHDGLANLRVTEAISEAARHGGTVELAKVVPLCDHQGA